MNDGEMTRLQAYQTADGSPLQELLVMSEYSLSWLVRFTSSTNICRTLSDLPCIQPRSHADMSNTVVLCLALIRPMGTMP